MKNTHNNTTVAAGTTEPKIVNKKPRYSKYSGEPVKIMITLGTDAKVIKMKDDLDIILRRHPLLKDKYKTNRSAFLVDMIDEFVKKNSKYL